MAKTKTPPILSTNTKTVASLDFDREATCPMICSYCYVQGMENKSPYRVPKTKRNHELAIKDPVNFAKQVNMEYKQNIKGKNQNWTDLEKLPLRIYGGGDFISEHLPILKDLEMPFYIISKSLTEESRKEELEELLKIPNLTKVVLSYDKDNINNYVYNADFLQHDKITTAFTGNSLLEYEDLDTSMFAILFNTKDTNDGVIEGRKYKNVCPENNRYLELAKSCVACNKCWSSATSKKLLS